MANAKKVSQSEMRQMMQKLKADKSDGGQADRKRKYKLSSKEMALLELEKKRKVEDKINQKKTVAQKAGVPENFFDSAKTKAFLNLGKAPQKSILKNSSSSSAGQTRQSSEPTKSLPAANSKAKGSEWTSSAPVLNKPVVDNKSSPPAKTLLRTPSGGTINHLEEDLAEEVAKHAPVAVDADKGDLPEGFFDDPVQDAKARGVEYKDADEAEWEAFKKEIAVEVAASADMTASEQIEETVDRQLEEIDDQMRAWSRVRNIEMMKDDVETKMKDKKTVTALVKEVVKEEHSDEESHGSVPSQPYKGSESVTELQCLQLSTILQQAES